MAELRDHLLLAVRLRLLRLVAQSGPLEELASIRVTSSEELVVSASEGPLEPSHRSLQALIASETLIVVQGLPLVLREMICAKCFQSADGSTLSIVRLPNEGSWLWSLDQSACATLAKVLSGGLLDLGLRKGLLGCQLLGEVRLSNLVLKPTLANEGLELRSVDTSCRCLDSGLLLSALVTEVT